MVIMQLSMHSQSAVEQCSRICPLATSSPSQTAGRSLLWPEPGGRGGGGGRGELE